MTKDFDTNLPSLPPGLSFYIGNDAAEIGGYEYSRTVFGVAVRESYETRFLWFAPRTKWRTRHDEQCDRTPTDVRKTVKELASRAWDEHHEREYAKKVAGYYPPKKLDNADGGL